MLLKHFIFLWAEVVNLNKSFVFQVYKMGINLLNASQYFGISYYIKSIWVSWEVKAVPRNKRIFLQNW